MKTVHQILTEKGTQVWTISPNASVYDALALMAQHQIGAVLVTDGNDIVGILSERDYARQVMLKGRSSRDTRVGDVMAKPVVCTRPDQTLEEAMALMTEKRVRHLPVIADGQLEGLVSIGDLVKAIISEHKFIIEQLENYIATG